VRVVLYGTSEACLGNHNHEFASWGIWARMAVVEAALVTLALWLHTCSYIMFID